MKVFTEEERAELYGLVESPETWRTVAGSNLARRWEDAAIAKYAPKAPPPKKGEKPKDDHKADMQGQEQAKHLSRMMMNLVRLGAGSPEEFYGNYSSMQLPKPHMKEKARKIANRLDDMYKAHLEKVVKIVEKGFL